MTKILVKYRQYEGDVLKEEGFEIATEKEYLDFLSTRDLQVLRIAEFQPSDLEKIYKVLQEHLGYNK